MDKQQVTQIRDAIVMHALPSVVFDGWTWGLIEQAAQDAGYTSATATAVFPDRMKDVLDALADLADREMLAALALAHPDPEALRVQDRVRAAVMARFEFLAPYKEAVRESTAFWIHPLNKPRAARIVWRTADRIWDWAGDTATDYNRYTKRGLLSGILASTMLAWLGANEENFAATKDFLDRRIDNALGLGKFINRFKNTRKRA